MRAVELSAGCRAGRSSHSLQGSPAVAGVVTCADGLICASAGAGSMWEKQAAEPHTSKPKGARCKFSRLPSISTWMEPKRSTRAASPVLGSGGTRDGEGAAADGLAAEA